VRPAVALFEGLEQNGGQFLFQQLHATEEKDLLPSETFPFAGHRGREINVHIAPLLKKQFEFPKNLVKIMDYE